MTTPRPVDRIGRYPTPVFEAKSLAAPDAELWIKNDGETHALYGGNKVRKLDRILADAVRRGARRIVTIGPVGSHHVLATTVFGRRRGFRVAALLFPQPRNPHVVDTIRCSMGQGLEPVPCETRAGALARFVATLRRGDYWLTAGGSNVIGTLGYVDAVEELVQQIREEVLPEPDVMVAPLGSGGTVAGLVVGTAREGLAARIVGVKVVDSMMVGKALVMGLALAVARRARTGTDAWRMSRQLTIDASEVGRGYGHATADGEAATAVARRIGLDLDPAYTAKAFAVALRLAAPSARPDLANHGDSSAGSTDRPFRVLYWHTLSQAPLGPLLDGAPAEAELPPSLRKLLVPREL